MLLVAAVALPLALLGAGALWAQSRWERARAEAQLVAQARTLARLVDREFGQATVVAQTLAHSTALAQGDLDAFEGEMRTAADLLSVGLPDRAGPATLRLVQADRTRLLDTSWPVGMRRTDSVPARPHVAAALETGQPVISNLFIAQELNRPLVAVAVPVRAPGAAAASPPWGIIGVSIPRERLSGLIAEAGRPSGGFASVQDRAGKTVVRTMRDAETVGKLPTPIVLAAIMAAESGVTPPGTRTLEGVPSTIAFARAPLSGFIVKLDIPEQVFLAPGQTALLRSAVVGALVLAGGLLVALLLARRVVTAFQRVPRLATAGASAVGTGLREADELVASLRATLAERRQAEQALQASEARFRTLADTTPQMVWSATAEGRHEYFNARWYAFTGLPAEGTTDAWPQVIHPEEWEDLFARWQHALRTGTPYEAEYRLRRHDGVWRWVLVRALPMHDEAGRVCRWFGCIVEIQEIVEARDVLARGHAELEQRVAARTRELEAAQARLAQAQRMEALGQLAGGIAHDFNNVLQAVQGGAALAERQADDAEAVRRLARMLAEATERGATVTRRLLSFARRGDLRAAPLDALALLGNMREILAHTLGGGVEVRLDLPQRLPPLLADKGQLETVLVNLATNARDAMAGSGRLTLAAAAESVPRQAVEAHPAQLAAGRYLRLSIADTGGGMDAATLARAAEPFFTTKPSGQGTGLGLSMAKGFAEQSGGGLWVESRPGHGTTVSLWLPAVEEVPPAVLAPDAQPGISAAAGARLLLVDDEPLVRTVLAAQLEAMGHAVLMASSANAALALLESGETVDLLVSDLSMPGMDGLGLIRAAQRRQPGLPAILLTGFVTDAAEIALGGALSGAFSLLNKPVEAQRLTERITALLEGARQAG